eukprot:CCRYP_001267-RG/>CCRYP_001267-RG protein AED:0.46 eAED:0.71 QI:0/0/0/1/0/0/3/0/222
MFALLQHIGDGHVAVSYSAKMTEVRSLSSASPKLALIVGVTRFQLSSGKISGFEYSPVRSTRNLHSLVFLLQSATYGLDLYTPTLSPGTATTRLINCFPFVETTDIVGLPSTSAEAVLVARPIFEFATASSIEGGGSKNTTLASYSHSELLQSSLWWQRAMPLPDKTLLTLKSPMQYLLHTLFWIAKVAHQITALLLANRAFLDALAVDTLGELLQFYLVRF